MKKKRPVSSRPAARTARKPRATKYVSFTMDEILKKFDEGKVPYRQVAEEDIDYSDIPPITAEEWKNFRPLWVNGRMEFPRPGGKKPAAEKPVPVNLDAGLFANLRREAKKKHTTCETLIHRILTDHLAHAR